MKHKFFFGALVCFILLLSVFSGCSRTKESASGVSASSGVQTSKAGKEVVIANVTDIKNLDVHAFQEVVTSRATRHIFSQLVKLTSDMKIHPDLAESWEFLSDTEIKFKLHKNVKWHDGTDFKASDVLFSFKRQAASPAVGYLMAPISEVIADDDYTVRILLKYKYAPIMANLAHVCSAILPEKALTEMGTAAFSINPIGTGSMKFVEMIPGDRVVLERFEDYFGEKALAPRIVFRTMPEEAARSIALETGEIDMDPEVAPPNVERVKSNPALKLYSWPSIFTEHVMFNNKKAPFDKLEVRQAISHCIDRETLINIAIEGHGRSTDTVLPIGVLGHTEDYPRYPRDIAKAKELLAKAGFPNGFNTVISVTGDLRTREAVLVQANLAEIGINAEIKAMENSALMDAYAAGDYDISISRWGNGTADPEGSIFVVFYSGQQGVAGNRAWFDNPEADAFLLAGRDTLVESERAAAYASATRVIMSQAPWVPLYNLNFLVGTRAELKGIDEHPTGYDHYDMLHYE